MEKEFEEIEKRNEWNALYQAIRIESLQHDYTNQESKKKENRDLNRYRDVTPYDHSRVCLQRLGTEDYINANLVEVPLAGRKYILTQGPLAATVGHFWLMIWEQKSKAVIMLNDLVERGQVKCHQYWPAFIGAEDDLDEVRLRVRLVSETKSEHYVLRSCLLTDEDSQESREVLQFHYTSWPDFGIPQTPASFLKFLFDVRDSGAFDMNVGPPVVHCSAGIGRSGTLCLVDSSLVLLETGKHSANLTIKDVLMEMRKYRMGLIQTTDQLRFSYESISKGAEIIIRPSLPSTASDSGFSGSTNELRQRQLNDVANKAADQQTQVTSQTSSAPNNNNHNPAEARVRERQARKRKTEENIQRIKERQRQQEERSRFQAKLVRLGGIGLAIIVGAGLIYSYLTQGSHPSGLGSHSSSIPPPIGSFQGP